MAYNFNNFKRRLEEIESWLQSELATIRIGRATAAILDNILVESYGAKMPINQLASIAIEDAKTLRISPWDAGQVKNIEKAITQADLGLSTAVDASGIRLSFPELTGERRQSLIKIAKEKLEEARVSVRQARTEIMEDLESKKKSGDLPEDDVKRHSEEAQKMVDEANKKLEEMFERKEGEVMG